MTEQEILDKRNKERELVTLANKVRIGANPLTITPVYSTVTEFRALLIKLMANAEGRTALEFAPMEALFDDAEVAAALNISETEAAAWRAKIKDLIAAKSIIDNYSSGMHFDVGVPL